MTRLPIPGSDRGTWGTVLNDFLGVEHNADGTLKLSGSLANKADASAVVEKDSLVLNVKDYGATGDDHDDDTVAIQSAINTAASAGGGVVFFPTGTYKISTALILMSSVSLRGAATSITSGGSTIHQTSATQDAVRAVNFATKTHSVSIECLRILGPGSSSGSGNGIYLKNTGSGGVHPPFAYWSIRDVMIMGFAGWGFNAEGAIVSVLERVICQSNANGFYLNGDAAQTGYSTVNTSTSFLSCYANGNDGDGYFVKASTYISFVGCAADSNGTGYHFLTCSNISLTGCGAEYGNPDDVSPGDSVKIESSDHVGMYNFFIYQNKHHGFWVTGVSKYVTLVGCNELDPVGGAIDGLLVDAGSVVTLLNTTIAAASTGGGLVTNLGNGAGAITAGSINATAGGANGISINPAASGFAPTIRSLGSDANVSLYLMSKGTGDITLADPAGNDTLRVKHSLNSQNYAVIQSANTGGSVNMGAAGNDTDVSLNLVTQGSGTVQINGVPILPRTPSINYINDTNGVEVLGIISNAAGVNYATLRPASTGQAVVLGVGGGDSNVYLNLSTKGTGLVQENGVPVVSTTRAQTLTNKTIGGGLVSADPTVALGIASKQYVDGRQVYDSYRKVGVSHVEAWYVAGQVNGLAMTTATPAINFLYAVPCVPGRNMTLDRISIQVTNTPATGKVRLGIFSNVASSTDLYPGNLLVDSGEFSTTAGGIFTATINRSLVGGSLYWFVYSAGGTASQVRSVAVGGCSTMLGTTSLLPATTNTYWMIANAYGALPASFPTDGSETLVSQSIPAIGYRLSA